jgi:hypothetical protein
MAHTSILNVEQLRRDAKRLSRAQGLTHSQALDRLAVERGYPNWSQLVKRHPVSTVASAPAAKSAPLSGAAVRQMLGLPKMDVSRAEEKTILGIVKRFSDVVGDAIEVRPLSLLMDMTSSRDLAEPRSGYPKC